MLGRSRRPRSRRPPGAPPSSQATTLWPLACSSLRPPPTGTARCQRIHQTGPRRRGVELRPPPCGLGLLAALRAPPVRRRWWRGRPTMGQDALALTDRDGAYGAVAFALAAREAGISPILGADLAVAPQLPSGRPSGHSCARRPRPGVGSGWTRGIPGSCCWPAAPRAGRRCAGRSPPRTCPGSAAGHCADAADARRARRGPGGAPRARTPTWAGHWPVDGPTRRCTC